MLTLPPDVMADITGTKRNFYDSYERTLTVGLQGNQNLSWSASVFSTAIRVSVNNNTAFITVCCPIS